MCLSLAGRGSWLLAGVLYALGLAGFLGGNVFYDSLLKDICPEKG
jgi:UMF1 family MFS transporter